MKHVRKLLVIAMVLVLALGVMMIGANADGVTYRSTFTGGSGNINGTYDADTDNFFVKDGAEVTVDGNTTVGGQIDVQGGTSSDHTVLTVKSGAKVKDINANGQYVEVKLEAGAIVTGKITLNGGAKFTNDTGTLNEIEVINASDDTVIFGTGHTKLTIKEDTNVQGLFDYIKSEQKSGSTAYAVAKMVGDVTLCKGGFDKTTTGCDIKNYTTYIKGNSGKIESGAVVTGDYSHNLTLNGVGTFYPTGTFAALAVDCQTADTTDADLIVNINEDLEVGAGHYGLKTGSTNVYEYTGTYIKKGTVNVTATLDVTGDTGFIYLRDGILKFSGSGAMNYNDNGGDYIVGEEKGAYNSSYNSGKGELIIEKETINGDDNIFSVKGSFDYIGRTNGGVINLGARGDISVDTAMGPNPNTLVFHHGGSTITVSSGKYYIDNATEDSSFSASVGDSAAVTLVNGKFGSVYDYGDLIINHDAVVNGTVIGYGSKATMLNENEDYVHVYGTFKAASGKMESYRENTTILGNVNGIKVELKVNSAYVSNSQEYDDVFDTDGKKTGTTPSGRYTHIHPVNTTTVKDGEYYLDDFKDGKLLVIDTDDNGNSNIPTNLYVRDERTIVNNTVHQEWYTLTPATPNNHGTRDCTAEGQNVTIKDGANLVLTKDATQSGRITNPEKVYIDNANLILKQGNAQGDIVIGGENGFSGRDATGVLHMNVINDTNTKTVLNVKDGCVAAIGDYKNVVSEGGKLALGYQHTNEYENDVVKTCFKYCPFTDEENCKAAKADAVPYKATVNGVDEVSGSTVTFKNALVAKGGDADNVGGTVIVNNTTINGAVRGEGYSNITLNHNAKILNERNDGAVYNGDDTALAEQLAHNEAVTLDGHAQFTINFTDEGVVNVESKHTNAVAVNTDAVFNMKGGEIKGGTLNITVDPTYLADNPGTEAPELPVFALANRGTANLTSGTVTGDVFNAKDVNVLADETGVHVTGNVTNNPGGTVANSGKLSVAGNVENAGTLQNTVGTADLKVAGNVINTNTFTNSGVATIDGYLETAYAVNGKDMTVKKYIKVTGSSFTSQDSATLIVNGTELSNDAAIEVEAGSAALNGKVYIKSDKTGVNVASGAAFTLNANDVVDTKTTNIDARLKGILNYGTTTATQGKIAVSGTSAGSNLVIGISNEGTTATLYVGDHETYTIANTPVISVGGSNSFGIYNTDGGKASIYAVSIGNETTKGAVYGIGTFEGADTALLAYSHSYNQNEAATHSKIYVYATNAFAVGDDAAGTGAHAKWAIRGDNVTLKGSNTALNISTIGDANAIADYTSAIDCDGAGAATVGSAPISGGTFQGPILVKGEASLAKVYNVIAKNFYLVDKDGAMLSDTATLSDVNTVVTVRNAEQELRNALENNQTVGTGNEQGNYKLPVDIYLSEDTNMHGIVGMLTAQDVDVKTGTHTLDLNGKTITTGSGWDVNAANNEGKQLFDIASGATLNIVDTATTKGQITNAASVAQIINSAGTLNIGTDTQAGAVITAANSAKAINGTAGSVTLQNGADVTGAIFTNNTAENGTCPVTVNASTVNGDVTVDGATTIVNGSSVTGDVEITTGGNSKIENSVVTGDVDFDGANLTIEKTATGTVCSVSGDVTSTATGKNVVKSAAIGTNATPITTAHSFTGATEIVDAAVYGNSTITTGGNSKIEDSTVNGNVTFAGTKLTVTKTADTAEKTYTNKINGTLTITGGDAEIKGGSEIEYTANKFTNTVVFTSTGTLTINDAIIKGTTEMSATGAAVKVAAMSSGYPTATGTGNLTVTKAAITAREGIIFNSTGVLNVGGATAADVTLTVNSHGIRVQHSDDTVSNANTIGNVQIVCSGNGASGVWAEMGGIIKEVNGLVISDTEHNYCLGIGTAADGLIKKITDANISYANASCTAVQSQNSIEEIAGGTYNAKVNITAGTTSITGGSFKDNVNVTGGTTTITGGEFTAGKTITVSGASNLTVENNAVIDANLVKDENATGTVCLKVGTSYKKLENKKSGETIDNMLDSGVAYILNGDETVAIERQAAGTVQTAKTGDGMYLVLKAPSIATVTLVDADNAAHPVTNKLTIYRDELRFADTAKTIVLTGTATSNDATDTTQRSLRWSTTNFITDKVTISDSNAMDQLSGSSKTVTLAKDTPIGTYTVTVTDLDNQTAQSASYVIDVVARPITDTVVTITMVPDQFKTTGSPIKPTTEISVKVNGNEMTQGTDYTLSYAPKTPTTDTNCIAVGTYTVTVTPAADLCGTPQTKDYTIVAKSLNDVTVTLTPSSFTYAAGTTRTPVVTVKDGNTTLTENTDYTISGTQSAEAAGTYTITVSGKGQYGDSVNKTWTITNPSAPPMGGGGAAAPSKYPVNASGVKADVTEAAAGETVTLTVPANATGLTVTDKDGNKITLTKVNGTTYTFEMPASAVKAAVDTAITWSNCPRTDVCALTQFNDVNRNAWYHDGIHYCLDNSIMNGVAANKFAPNMTATRATIVTMLARIAGVDTTKGDTWYSAAVEWGMKVGVTDGTNMGNNITREQIVTMLYRYAKLQGIDVSVGETTNILSFKDASSVSGYAMDAMQWAVGAGVVEGDNGNLKPGALATRAEIATMIMRYCENILK